MSNGGVVTQGLGSSGTTAEGGHAESVIQGQILPVLEHLESAVENAMNELSAKGLGLKATYTRLIEVIDKVVQKQPDYFTLNVDKLSPGMMITIGLRGAKNERN